MPDFFRFLFLLFFSQRHTLVSLRQTLWCPTAWRSYPANSTKNLSYPSISYLRTLWGTKHLASYFQFRALRWASSIEVLTRGNSFWYQFSPLPYILRYTNRYFYPPICFTYSRSHPLPLSTPISIFNIGFETPLSLRRLHYFARTETMTQVGHYHL